MAAAFSPVRLAPQNNTDAFGQTVRLATQNNTDAFGQSAAPVGAPLQQARPIDPNDQPNPANPGGISNNELRRRQQALRASNAITDQNRNTRFTGTGRTFDEAVQGGGYQSSANGGQGGFVKPAGKTFGEHLGDVVRIAGGAAQTAVNPFGVLGSDYNDVSVFLNPVGQGTAGVIDEVTDRFLPGGSGTKGPDIIPFIPSGGDGVRGASQTGGGSAASPFGGGNTNPDPGSVGSFTGGFSGGRPEDALVGGNARAVAGGIAGMNDAGNAGVASLQQQIQNGQGAFATGVGSGGIRAVDAALTGYDPRFSMPGAGSMGATPGQVSMGALPGTGSMGALPGTGAMGALPGTTSLGALPGTVSMGALPGATQRDIQLSALDRVLGFDPNTSSVAQQQLVDAGQRNLSNSLALARSARGGPAAQAQALRMAQAEGAATMSETGRNLAILRATEESAAKERELKALGLEGDISTGIRGADVGERGQNVSALEAALSGDVTQRGQTVGALEADLAAGVNQRGQTIGALETDRTAGVAERGQTIGALEAERNAGVSERGQTIGALEAALAGDVTQRGQTIEQQVAERNAGVSERGQDITANTAMSQRELDAIMGRGDLAQTERNAGVTERGQTINATTSLEQVKQARDAVTASALTEAEKTEAITAFQKAQLGYEETPAEKEYFMRLAAKLGVEPDIFGLPAQDVKTGLALIQAIASLAV